MRNVLKRNQVIILVIALMLVSAGYLSYTGNNKEEGILETSTSLDSTVTTTATTSEEEIEYAGIGDAKLVNSNNVVEENNEQVAIVPNNEENVTLNEIISDEAASITTSADNTDNNLISKETKEYFSESRLNRETMYSQMLESYQKILQSETISETQKAIAQTEIKNINDIKNKIMICENLIKTKGIEDLIIFVNDKSINVVVSSKELEQEKIAQIQNIIEREMNAEVSDIHISNK